MDYNRRHLKDLTRVADLLWALISFTLPILEGNTPSSMLCIFFGVLWDGRGYLSHCRGSNSSPISCKVWWILHCWVYWCCSRPSASWMWDPISVWISSSYCMLTCMWSGLQECFQQPAWGETRSLKQLGLPLQHYTHLCTHCRVVIRLYSVSNHILQSEEGYPLGHLLFCTTIHPFTGSRCYYIYGWWGQLSLYYICDCTYMCMQIVELLVWAKNAHFSIISKC